MYPYNCMDACGMANQSSNTYPFLNGLVEPFNYSLRLRVVGTPVQEFNLHKIQSIDHDCTKKTRIFRSGKCLQNWQEKKDDVLSETNSFPLSVRSARGVPTSPNRPRRYETTGADSFVGNALPHTYLLKWSTTTNSQRLSPTETSLVHCVKSITNCGEWVFNSKALGTCGITYEISGLFLEQRGDGELDFLCTGALRTGQTAIQHVLYDVHFPPEERLGCGSVE